MKYLISFDSKNLSMNWEKLIFQWEKWNFEPTGNSLHTTEILAFGKAILASLYVKLKLYTNLLSLHKLLCL